MRYWLKNQLLPKTGQTTSYSSGDDGDFQAGFARPRFRDNNNGTITDFATGLMWVKQPELIIPGATGVHATNQIQVAKGDWANDTAYAKACLLYTSPSPRDRQKSRMPSSA